MSCLHIAVSVWTSLFCVFLVVLLIAGCNESDSITRAIESKYPNRRPGRLLRSLGCLEQSEKNVKIGSHVTLIADRQAFQNSFNNVPYIWNDAMTSLLGQTVTVVDRPQSGIFGLTKSDPSSNEPVWWYPFSVIACVKDNGATTTTRTQPTTTTFATKTKVSVPTTKHRTLPKREKGYASYGYYSYYYHGSPHKEPGHYYARENPTTAPTSWGRRDYYYRHPTTAPILWERDYFIYYDSWRQRKYESTKHACSVLAGFEVPALALMICLTITTALSARLLRKIEQAQPEIELLPAGKVVVLACEDTAPLIKANDIDDAQVTNDVNSTTDLKTEQNE